MIFNGVKKLKEEETSKSQSILKICCECNIGRYAKGIGKNEMERHCEDRLRDVASS